MLIVAVYVHVCAVFPGDSVGFEVQRGHASIWGMALVLVLYFHVGSCV